MRVRRAQARLLRAGRPRSRDASLPVIPAKAGTQSATDAAAAPRQNQDLLDYRIFRILSARVPNRQSLIHIPLGEISGCGEKRKLGKRNPENPDSDKCARSSGNLSSIFLSARFPVMAKSASWESEILKIPPILKILILTNARRRPPLSKPGFARTI